MINLNKCKFGDRLRTMDGRMALFLGRKSPSEDIICVIEDSHYVFLSMWYNNNGTASDSVYGERYNIIAKWEDEV